MYYLRLYELMTINKGHVITMNWFDQGYGRHLVGPGFANAINYYYGYQVWK